MLWSETQSLYKILEIVAKLVGMFEKQNNLKKAFELQSVWISTDRNAFVRFLRVWINHLTTLGGYFTDISMW